jgi:flagellar basal body-associated protein FliL
MKHGDSPLNRILGPSRLVRGLFYVSVGLVAAIALGSAVALCLGLPGKRSAADDPAAWQRERTGESDGLANFAGIGNLRVKSADKKPSLLSATIVLGIPSGDRAFREELISKEGFLREACRKLLGSKKAADLSPAFSLAIKAQLRDILNAGLSLGKVEAVYFTVYQLID